MQIQDELQNKIIEQLSQYSEEARQEEQQKSKYRPSKLKDLFPTNYYQQRSYFFEKNKKYNPYFTYNSVVSPEIRQINTEHEALAQKILLNNTFKTISQPNLKIQEVLQIIQKYLEEVGLDNFVQVKFQKDCLPRTSVVYYKNKIILKIREPIQYNKTNLEGVLNHEIGTHIVRYLNHKQNSARKPSQQSKIFEEGLAAINQLLPQQRPFLFKAALRYCAVIQASKSNFIQLYQFINKYVHDENDCWREAVRAKRGLSTTQLFGAYSKDQNYLIGAIQILKNRNSIDFEKCFYSKLSASQGKNIQSGVLPPFMNTEEKKKLYRRRIQTITLCNFSQLGGSRKRSYENIDLNFE